MSIIFAQERLGQYEQPITIYKLRTMQVGAEQRFSALLDQQGTETGLKITDDPRITPIGKFLRRYFIDETPQLYNLLRGDIRLVGVRPRTAESWKRFPRDHKRRVLQHKPALLSVSYAQPGVRDLQDIIEVENEYLRRKEQDPQKTDTNYLSRIVENIVVHGARSQ